MCISSVLYLRNVWSHEQESTWPSVPLIIRPARETLTELHCFICLAPLPHKGRWVHSGEVRYDTQYLIYSDRWINEEASWSTSVTMVTTAHCLFISKTTFAKELMLHCVWCVLSLFLRWNHRNAPVTSHSRASYGLLTGCSRAVLNKNRTPHTDFAFPHGARRVLMHAF